MCLVNATATGTELLKNLVLPGMGSFTIVDAEPVSARDLGNNFFVTKRHLGQPRARCACELLTEMNPDVKGDWLAEGVDALLAKNPTFFNSFTVVVATGLPEASLLPLAAILWAAKVPLLVARSYGMVGTLRLVTEEHSGEERKQ